jgi:hypothetical protein
MTTTPDPRTPDDDDQPDQDSSEREGAPGAELGMSEGEGSTFEPEEDPEGFG